MFLRCSRAVQSSHQVFQFLRALGFAIAELGKHQCELNGVALACSGMGFERLDREVAHGAPCRAATAFHAAYRPSFSRRAMPMPVRAASTGRTVAARLPLKLRAMSCAARGEGAAVRIDWTALTCSGSVLGHAMTLSGSTTAASPKSSVWLTGAE